MLRDALFMLLWQQQYSSSGENSSTSRVTFMPHMSSNAAGSNAQLHQQMASSASAAPSAAAARSYHVLPGIRILRQELCEGAGRLFCQLYDRACRQPFAPPAAFHAVGLLPEQFLQV
jgi:hypothetical protein